MPSYSCWIRQQFVILMLFRWWLLMMNGFMYCMKLYKYKLILCNLKEILLLMQSFQTAFIRVLFIFKVNIFLAINDLNLFVTYINDYKLKWNFNLIRYSNRLYKIFSKFYQIQNKSLQIKLQKKCQCKW